MRVDLEIMPILLRVFTKTFGCLRSSMDVLRSSMERKSHLPTWLNCISRTVVSNYHSKIVAIYV